MTWRNQRFQYPIRDPDCLLRVVRAGAKYADYKSCPDPVLRPYCVPEQCFLARGEPGAKQPLGGVSCESTNMA